MRATSSRATGTTRIPNGFRATAAGVLIPCHVAEPAKRALPPRCGPRWRLALVTGVVWGHLVCRRLPRSGGRAHPRRHHRRNGGLRRARRSGTSSRRSRTVEGARVRVIVRSAPKPRCAGCREASGIPATSRSWVSGDSSTTWSSTSQLGRSTGRNVNTLRTSPGMAHATLAEAWFKGSAGAGLPRCKPELTSLAAPPHGVRLLCR
jgi:hypothetical protein